MSLFALTALATTLVSPTADAASRADITPTLVPPAALGVYEEGRFEVVVDNIGRKNADDVELHIYLPQTHTSPGVHVLGIVGAMDSRCSQSGLTIICDLGRIRSGRSDSAWVELALPWSSEDIEVATAVATSSRESDARNNEDSAVIGLAYDDVPLTRPEAVDIRLCSGTNLTAFFECTTAPSSIVGHSIVLEADGSISFPGAAPIYTGVWSQGSADALAFTYLRYGIPVLNFSGNGVPGDCFEGLATFPGSTSVAPYEVCTQ
jgi:hypothetical protein